MKRIVIVILLLGMVVQALFAKNGEEHIADMCSVFGTLPTNPRLMPIFRSVTSEIDNGKTGRQKITLNQRLKRASGGAFKWGLYTHRIFFHWGFNGDPRKSVALKECIDRCVQDEWIRERMWKVVIAEQRRRNGRMISQVKRYTTYKGSDNKQKGFAKGDVHNAIAALAYDVHIIGDYIEGKDVPSQALVSLQGTQNDIIKAMENITRNDPEFTGQVELKSFILKMRNTQSGIEKIRAQKIMLIMKECIPEILMKSGLFKRVLELEKYSSGISAMRQAA